MIVKNQIRCKHCLALVVSAYRHDFHSHSCEEMKRAHPDDAEICIAADGGNSYLRRVGNREDWEEASEVQP